MDDHVLNSRRRRNKKVVRLKVGKEMERMKNKYLLDPNHQNVDGVDILPATYRTHSREDDRFDLRAKLAQDNMRARVGAGAVPGASGFDLQRDDFEFLSDKRDELEEETFERWYARSVNLGERENVEWTHKVIPEFQDRREDEVRAKLSLMKSLALINLRGPETKRDLMVLYAVQMGYVDPAILRTVMAPDPARPREVVPGLLNPRKSTFTPRTLGVEPGIFGEAFQPGPGREGQPVPAPNPQGLVTSVHSNSVLSAWMNGIDPRAAPARAPLPPPLP